MDAWDCGQPLAVVHSLHARGQNRRAVRASRGERGVSGDRRRGSGIGEFGFHGLEHDGLDHEGFDKFHGFDDRRAARLLSALRAELDLQSGRDLFLLPELHQLPRQ